jgi:hypothetical protein
MCRDKVGQGDHVVVEKKDQQAAYPRDTEIARGGWSRMWLFDQLKLVREPQLPERALRAVGRPIVDHDNLEFMRRVGLAGERL